MPRRGLGRRAIRLVFAFGALFALLAGAPAASAVTDGPCTASFNGVDSSRVDSLDSPLELDASDVLTFHGTDETGTQSARVEVVLAMVTVRDGAATYGPLQNEFSASLDLDDVSPYGVGLYRVRGMTDNCTVEAWVRISGRFPFATLTGLTAGGLALGGFAAQMTAIAARRRRSVWAAALAGIITGVGIAGIGQQFGRMQLSIPSILIVAAITAVIGALVALLLTPSRGPGWWARRRDAGAQRRAIRYQARLEAARLDSDRREAEAAAAETAQPEEPPAGEPTRTPILSRSAESPEPDPAPDPDPAPPTPAAEPAPDPAPPTPIAEPAPDPAPPTPAAEPAPDPVPPATAAPPAPVESSPVIEGPSWCYVLAPVDVFDLSDHTEAVGLLQPGSWYLAKRQVGGWVQVAVGDGTEGWVAQSAVHKHG